MVAIIALLVAQPSSKGDDLSATNNTPKGSKAIAQVLRSQGVTVTSVSTMKEVQDAITTKADATIFLYDPNSFLDASKLHELEFASDHLVVMQPTFDQLNVLAPNVAQSGLVTGILTADCDYPPARRAEKINAEGTGFRIIGAETDAISCFDSGDRVKSVIVLSNGSHQTVLLGTFDAFTNQHVADEGNAALALGTLGETRDLVWFLPSIVEATSGPVSLVGLTPGWVTPLLTFLFIVFLVAALWRGRRFGKLAVENLPVVVPASETMEGRARLYAASGARLRALDALRVGTLTRVGNLLGLPRSANLNEVLSSIGSLTNRPEEELRTLFVDAEPHTDRELVDYSDQLLRLEKELKSILSPTANPNGESK